MKGFCFLLVSLCLLHSCLAGRFISFPYDGRDNKLFIPSHGGIVPRPLFVMLHGCTQNATDFATGTKMNTYGDIFNFYVLYPDQPTSANIAKCWNWFVPEDQVRGSGEPEIIVSMAKSVQQQYLIDASKIFIAGLSAGAAMSDILGVTYPDYFSGVAVASGLEYKAATDIYSALAAQAAGGPDPNTQGAVAYAAMGPYARAIPVLVTHGTADVVVAPINGQQVVSSWAKTLDLVLGHGVSHGFITDTPTAVVTAEVPAGHTFTTHTYADHLTGETLITYITVDGMPHAWSGGSAAGTYTDPEGPDASLIMISYFLLTNPVY